MKKLLVFLLACFACTAMFAQEIWTPDDSGCAGTNCYIYGRLFINGEYAGAENLYIGVFDQDGICRGVGDARWLNSQSYYYYAITCKGYNGCTYTNFKVWDIAANVERTDLSFESTWPTSDDLVAYPDGFPYEGTKKYGAPKKTYALNFTMESTGYDLTITPYSGTNDHYYLIASPVSVNPSAVTNMLENFYDLYYFNQAGDGNGNQWITYKDTEGATDPGFGLVPGKGYLYANAGDGNDTYTLTFPAGNEYDGDGSFELEFADGDWAGWNLVGNPYLVEAYIDKDEFYVMNEAGTEIEPAETNTVARMQGVFVQATGEDQSVTFSTTDPGKKTPKLSLNLVSNNNVIDRAIVNFGEGSMPKFQINKNSTKLYIPRNGEDYAVVNSEEMGEMPVSFKAESNGTYSLNLSSENVDFAYLHLIDNLTGADQDLLANPSYSFSANTTDYASRFRLVFATGNDEDSFAFFSNGSLFVNNEGSAVLQVVDVTGRILKSESINGCASVNFDAAPGVYMVRLVNGDNMKVQKVVK